MARIRTIKPEFHAHEELSALPPETHLFAAALLNYADDEGYFNANPILVKAGTNPLRKDATPLELQLHQLAKIGYIEIRRSGNQCIGRILTFDLHQRVTHPTKSKIRGKFELLPQDSGEQHELFSPEGNREGNREQGTGNVRAILQPSIPHVPPSPRQEFSTPTATIQPMSNPDVAVLVKQIVIAHPRSLIRKTRMNEVTYRQTTSVLQAMEDEIEYAGCSTMAALEMILERVELQAKESPPGEWQFFKDIERYMELHEYRLEPEVIIRKDKGNNGNGHAKTRTGRNLEALRRADELDPETSHPAQAYGAEHSAPSGDVGRGPGRLLEGS